MGLPCLNVYTIHNMVTYQLLSHVFLTHVFTLAFRSLWITCAPANPPSYSFSLLVSYKPYQKGHQNDQNTLGYFQKFQTFVQLIFQLI